MRNGFGNMRIIKPMRSGLMNMRFTRIQTSFLVKITRNTEAVFPVLTPITVMPHIMIIAQTLLTRQLTRQVFGS